MHTRSLNSHLFMLTRRYSTRLRVAQVAEKVAAMEATVAPLGPQLSALRHTLDTAVLPALAAELGAHASAQAQQAAAQVAAASTALSELAVLLPGASLLFGPAVRGSLRSPAAAGRAPRATAKSPVVSGADTASLVPTTAAAMAALPPFKSDREGARAAVGGLLARLRAMEAAARQERDVMATQLEFHRKCYAAQAKHALAAVRAAAAAAAKAAAQSAATSGAGAAAAKAVMDAHEALRAQPSEASVQALVHAVMGAAPALSSLAAVRILPLPSLRVGVCARADRSRLQQIDHHAHAQTPSD
jgi:hypothetical protein